jgi:hypothetical protein
VLLTCYGLGANRLAGLSVMPLLVPWTLHFVPVH